MHLKLTLRTGDSVDDIRITVDTTATVSDVAEAITRARPDGHPRRGEADLSLRVDEPAPSRVVPGSLTIAEAGVQSGQTVSVVSSGGRVTSTATPKEAAATLQVVEGTKGQKEYPLAAGANQVGRSRSSDVRLSDPMVSNRHLRINVTDRVEIIDLNSANGVFVDGSRVDRSQIASDNLITIGGTTFRVSHHQGHAATGGASPVVEFNRSPLLDPLYDGREFVAPEPPKPNQPARFPLIPMLAPLVLGMVLFAVTRSLVSILFIAMSPLMMAGSFLENRFSGKKSFEAEKKHFISTLRDLAIQMNHAAEVEAVARRAEAPSTAQVVEASRVRQPMLWTRRPDRRSFLALRVGLGALPARNSLKMPTSNNTTPELWRELESTRDEYAIVEEVPVVADLPTIGTVGIAGPRASTLPLVHSAIAQMVGLHSPSEVVICALVSEAVSDDWMWLRWLPHSSSDHSPIEGVQLASNQTDCTRLVANLEDLVALRRKGDGGVPSPAVLLVVDDDTPVERSRLVEIAEHGPSAGVFVVWHAPSVTRLPAACRVFLDATVADTPVAVGFIDPGVEISLILADTLDATSAEDFARSLAALKDSGARVDDDSDLPATVSLLDLVGLDVAVATDAVLASWQQTGSLSIADGASVATRSSPGLRAVVGLSASEMLSLDLRTQGPHALVGGTTGSGKSEFLQAWVMGMALAHSPLRISFLFVDYKGGAAFSGCERLPHSVGIVTDLNQHLVRRVLTSLRAELHYRERILNEKKAKDLLELERRRDPDAPPSLVIVVDEFAALATDIPEFVDGVVDIAQRGRSLGLHLILATQRPAGVIKDNLRANTNLRVALRMADEEDSLDVIGTSQAATFDPSLPGRAVAKLGPGRLTTFQSAYVGGWTSGEPTQAPVRIEGLRFGTGTEWIEPADAVDKADDDLGPNDLLLLVDNLCEAAERAEIPRPRIPWLPELGEMYDLAKFSQSRSDKELIFAQLDDPAHQEQRPVAFLPDRDGNMAIFGTGGSGKSTTLKTIGIVAGLTSKGGPCHVYGLDFGSRSLNVLEQLPHVGSIINGADEERIERLIRWLAEEIDRRAEQYGEAGTLVDYREQADRPDEPRILLLIDNFGAFRQSYEVTYKQRLFELFERIVGEGRQVGIHVILTADRAVAVPSSVSSSIQQTLVLRLADEADYGHFGVASDVLLPTSPPGRGFFAGYETQVVLLGGSPSVALQAQAISELGEHLASTLRRSPAPPIRNLPTEVVLSDLPSTVGSLPVLGISSATLEPVGWHAEGSLVLSGSVNSGRTEVLAAMLNSLLRSDADRQIVRFAPTRSRLSAEVDFLEDYEKAESVATAAENLRGRIERGEIDPSVLTVVLEQVPEFLTSEADVALQSLIRTCQDREVLIIADGDSSSLGQSWPLLQLLKASRHGLAVQPDDLDGDSIFKTPLGRIAHNEFPFARAMYIRKGVATKVQCAILG